MKRHSGEDGMKVYSIGFTKKTAAQFFTTLRQAEIRRLLDVRLHNVSQLAGFTKRNDLSFFLKELCGAEYLHEPLLTPTPDLPRWISQETRQLAGVRAALSFATG
jgi:hypothetical protein